MERATLTDKEIARHKWIIQSYYARVYVDAPTSDRMLCLLAR